MSQMLQEKRATRGKRMSALVGQAAEEDEVFYNNEIWQEGSDSDAESYSTEEEKPDLFDSDFDESEDSDEEDSIDEDQEKELRNSEKRAKKVAEPKVQKRPRAAVEPEIDQETGEQIPKPKKKKVVIQDFVPSAPRSVRDSTKAKTTENYARLKEEEETRPKVRREPKPKVVFDQMEMLKEALDTEEENYRWILRKKRQIQVTEIENEAHPKAAKKFFKDFIHFHSAKNEGNSITFSSFDVMPDFLKGTVSRPSIPQKTCVITGLPAKYRDPKTMLPYANLEAYRELQRRIANNELYGNPSNRRRRVTQSTSSLDLTVEPLSRQPSTSSLLTVGSTSVPTTPHPSLSNRKSVSRTTSQSKMIVVDEDRDSSYERMIVVDSP